MVGYKCKCKIESWVVFTDGDVIPYPSNKEEAREMAMDVFYRELETYMDNLMDRIDCDCKECDPEKDPECVEAIIGGE